MGLKCIPINEHTAGRRRVRNYVLKGNSNSLFEYKDGEGDFFFPRTCVKPACLLEEIAFPLRYMPGL